MKKILKTGVLLACAAVLVCGCAKTENKDVVESLAGNNGVVAEKKVFEGATVIELSDEEIKVDGRAASGDENSAVYVARDIVYYQKGKDFTYGEGTEADEHSEEEADEHVVVHITKPGAYAVSGSLSAGQIAVDLGEDAEEDPEAVVTLILNGADVQCSVAPAVIFYNVYECGSSDVNDASSDVDTSGAGANVLIADGTINNITGSYVARIYKSVELDDAGTKVVDSKKLHKYDGAFYSKMSMNVNGDEIGDGVLYINAENEGLDSELHLTINGGNINIISGNDGINTNEDEVSVTTINGGSLNIRVSGETGEGDGIDSNGWLVINGGTVIAQACSSSADSGIDSDMGIHINGGTLIASGNMFDHISESQQNFAVFTFDSGQKGGTKYTLKTKAGEEVISATPNNDFSYLIVSSEELTEGTYTLWNGVVQMTASKEDAMGGFGGMMGRPGGMIPSEGMELPEGLERPGGMELPEGLERPGGMELPEGLERPEGMEPPKGMERPEGNKGNWGKPEGRPNGFGIGADAETSTDLEITQGGNYFNHVKAATQV